MKGMCTDLHLTDAGSGSIILSAGAMLQHRAGNIACSEAGLFKFAKLMAHVQFFAFSSSPMASLVYVPSSL